LTEDDRIFGGNDDLVHAGTRDPIDAIYGQDGNEFIRDNLSDNLIYSLRAAPVILTLVIIAILQGFYIPLFMLTVLICFIDLLVDYIFISCRNISCIS
jgi:hypothetical protein